ncbi:MAG: ComEC/Rec2 family competence protein [Candidatus Gracilibacteria bacterium]|nr:ComEC/Rec2 family competence protein [Candidatus Gracilibacteria bacterium]
MIKNLRIHDQTLFFLGSLGVLSGIFLSNIFRENIVWIVYFVGILSIQILFFYRLSLRYIVITILSFCFGGYMSLQTLHDIDSTMSLFEKETVFFTKDILVTGTLTEKIGETNKTARYILRDITLGTQKIPKKAGIIVSFPDSRGKEIDDSISFTGKLSLPINNEAFDYQKYLLLDDIFATVSVSFPEKKGMAHSSWISIYVREIRLRLLSIIESIYPGESAKLLEGMLIGERANLLPETKKSFNNSGMTHIIAVSGFNITIILIFLSFLFRSFPLIVRLILAILCIGFFTLLVGPQISVLRASVFGIISYAILLSGKKMRAFSLLIGVGIVFVLLNPLILNYDISFHLSFLAVFGLLFFGDFFTRMFSFLPKWFGIWEALSMCFAAMAFTLPIIMVNFGQVSLISPIANLAIVPIIPLIMLVGFLSILITIFSVKIGILIGFPTWLGLSYILHTIQWFGSLPYAVLPVNLVEYRWMFECVYFMILIFCILYFSQKEEVQ